ncbi:MAG: hypothetical protein IKW90_15745 [Lachnospiraceae bacterium]|nr:hypothetical protein [Lachnospiraceae bacterium]
MNLIGIMFVVVIDIFCTIYCCIDKKTYDVRRAYLKLFPIFIIFPCLVTVFFNYKLLLTLFIVSVLGITSFCITTKSEKENKQ